LPEEEYTQRLFGRRNHDILRAVLGDLPQGEIEELARRKEEAFRRLVRGHVAALPGARELIEGARGAGKKQAIVSSTPLENIALVLDSLGLRDCFDAIVGEEDVERGKPDPQGFLLGSS